jgi:hypothetical protein
MTTSGFEPLFPSDGEPTRIRDCESGAVQGVLRPYMTVGLIVDFLRRHFSGDARRREWGGVEEDFTYNVVASELRGRLWKNLDESSILIESVRRWDPTQTGKRPALLVGRGAFQKKKFLIGDRRQADFSLSGASDYSVLWVGSCSVFAVSPSPGEVELLADEALQALDHFAPVVRQWFSQLLAWEVVEVGPVSRLEEARWAFAAPISVGWAMVDSWRLTPQAPLLRKVQLTVGSLVGVD